MLNAKSIIEAWLSLVERCVRDAEVACSNHVASTPWQGHRDPFHFFHFFVFYKSGTIVVPDTYPILYLKYPICFKIKIVTNKVAIDTAELNTTNWPAS